MNNYGFNSLNNSNPLAQFLRDYIPQQPQEQSQIATKEPQRVNNSGIVAFEINSKSDIEYIEPERSGRRQIYICDNENKIYTGRYNHARKEMDYRVYIDEGEMRLTQQNDTSAEMSQIAQALVLVVNKLEDMSKSIDEMRSAEPKVIEKIIEKPVEVPVVKEVVKEIPVEVETKPKRDANGKFIKKGGDK